MNTFRVIREVPADGVQVEAVSILKFLIFRLIDLNVTVLCFDQQIASGASVAFQSFFMDAVTLLDCRDHVGGLSLGPVVSVRVAVAIRSCAGVFVLQRRQTRLMFKGSVCFLGKVAVCATDAGLTVLRSNHSFHVVVVSRDRLNTGSFICSVIQTQASNEIPAFDGVSGQRTYRQTSRFYRLRPLDERADRRCLCRKSRSGYDLRGIGRTCNSSWLFLEWRSFSGSRERPC